MRKKPMPNPVALDGTKLWDEILKAIVSAMPSQLFPLFKEVYGREYPKGTSIVVLGSETSSFQEDSNEPPGSTLMDIALLVAGTDYYHLECQMKNDAIPDYLRCRVFFQDNSEHIYKIPTVKIQTYTLKEIKEKHLTLFIPYTILRLRPRLKADLKHPLTQKELTEFIEKVIFVLKEELFDEYLTEREYRNYVRLFHFAVDRVLATHQQMREEVHRMTEPLIKLPSVIEDELRAEIANQKLLLDDKNLELRNKDVEIKNKDAEIQRLKTLVKQLSSDNTQ